MTGELHKGEGLREIANSAPENGSFAFDEETMRSLIRQWLDLADSYDASTTHARQMALVEAPGLDFASRAQAEAASSSGRSYAEYLQHNRDYCLQQAQLFQDALDDYLGVEHTNIVEINKAPKV